MKIHIFALRWRDVIKRSSQLRTLLKRVVVNRTWKKFRPVRDLNSWPLRYRCSALPIELTSQLGAGQWIGYRCSTGLPFCFELSQKSFTLLKQLDFLVRRVSSLKAQCRVASKILKNRLYLTNAQTIDCCAKVHNSATGYSPPSHPPFSFCSKTSSQILVELCRLVFLKRTLFQIKTCHFPSRFHT